MSKIGKRLLSLAIVLLMVLSMIPAQPVHVHAAETTDVVESEKENPYMIIPASASAVPFTISADIDGKPYNIEVAMTEAFAPGKVYKISVKITNVGLVVDSVVIVQNWDEEELTGGNLAPKP